ncbi:MAG: Lrp/AsnC family transcriptional regulator, partial [Candidatus Thorarchaeota archaeon]
YGKYNGYIAQTAYPLSSPITTSTLLNVMQEEDLVVDYHIFDIVDYEYKRADYRYFNTDSSWSWDWTEWYTQIDRNLNAKESSPPSMELNPRIVDFDSKDVLLLKHIARDSEMTQRQLSEHLGLSETQVNKKLHRMEKTGIIKGYRSVFSPYSDHGMIVMFLELEEPVDGVLRSLYQLPFQLYVMMESRTRYCIRFSLSSRDHKGFLRGFDIIRPHLASYFFQTLHNPPLVKPSYPLDLFEEETCTWNIPLERSIRMIHSRSAGR